MRTQAIEGELLKFQYELDTEREIPIDGLRREDV